MVEEKFEEFDEEFDAEQILTRIENGIYQNTAEILKDYDPSVLKIQVPVYINGQQKKITLEQLCFILFNKKLKENEYFCLNNQHFYLLDLEQIIKELGINF